MNWGDLRSEFRGVAWKRITPHEVDRTVSNGHEFQGVSRLKDLLGEDEREFSAIYMLLNEDSDDIETIQSVAKWYDSRAGQSDRTPEWRLYYPSAVNDLLAHVSADDFMVIASTKIDQLAIMFAQNGSGREAQLRLLFNLPESDATRISVRRYEERQTLGFIAASILEELGLGRVEAPTEGDGEVVQRLIAQLTHDYTTALPSGKVVGELVRANLHGVDAVVAPDETLVRWIEAEAAVFRGWEDGKIARRIIKGFLFADGAPDVEEYRKFSMFLRQSRVSRAGGALEAHFETILLAHRVRFDAQPKIDGGERPDFLFPGKAEYNDSTYPADRLRILGAKYTAKDRWRQVLNEGVRVRIKHLLTLEAVISSPQLALMHDAKLQLVIPLPIQLAYPEASRGGLLSIADFLEEVRGLQMTDSTEA